MWRFVFDIHHVSSDINVLWIFYKTFAFPVNFGVVINTDRRNTFVGFFVCLGFNYQNKNINVSIVFKFNIQWYSIGINFHVQLSLIWDIFDFFLVDFNGFSYWFCIVGKFLKSPLMPPLWEMFPKNSDWLIWTSSPSQVKDWLFVNKSPEK